MNETVKVILMNLVMALITALVWGVLVRFAGASWPLALVVYSIAAVVLFIALCVVCTTNGARR